MRSDTHHSADLHFLHHMECGERAKALYGLPYNALFNLRGTFFHIFSIDSHHHHYHELISHHLGTKSTFH